MLLALAGLGSGLFLFVVFPWLTTSRAVDARMRPLHGSASSRESAAQLNAGADSVEANEVQLGPALVAPGVADEASMTAETEPTDADSGVDSIAGSVPDTSALVASETTDAGPKLRYLKGGGRAEKTSSADIHAAQRAKRQEQRAEGIDPKAAQATARAEAKAAGPNPNREKINNGAGDSARAQSPGKGKRRKKQPPPGG